MRKLLQEEIFSALTALVIFSEFYFLGERKNMIAINTTILVLLVIGLLALLEKSLSATICAANSLSALLLSTNSWTAQFRGQTFATGLLLDAAGIILALFTIYAAGIYIRKYKLSPKKVFGSLALQFFSNLVPITLISMVKM